jgi:hypothetical protein
VDELAGTGMLNLLDIYVQQTPPTRVMLLIVLFIILGFGVEFPQLYISDSYPNCQFVGLTCIGRCYWYHALLHPERDQLQNCLDRDLAELENWVKANKHSEPSNETIFNSLLQQNFFVCKLIIT